MSPHATTRAERVVDSGIIAASRLGRLTPQSWMGIFIVFGMTLWTMTLWWFAGTFSLKLDQNTQALTRCAAAMERIAIQSRAP